MASRRVVKVAAPRLRDGLRAVALSVDELGDEAFLEDLALTELDLGAASGRLVDMTGCRWTQCRLAGSELEKLTISDTVFDHCDLANARWADSSAVRTEFLSCRLTGMSAPTMSLQHVTIRDSILDLSSWRFAKFSRVEFIDCRLTNADFVSAELGGTVFRGCDLSGAEFSNATANKAVFVECQWEGTRGIGSLGGATIANTSPTDHLAVAAAMASALQITLAHPDAL
ncbi:pentapeptide repeat-containing protein [Kribbella sp. NBC_01245]|uniref:pentapeptide repeat-containing protein n=1 Tax=Kribbella sp. NBC_01245 TaxID=2903578 RepID=UPI002E2E03F7|nr:pentapeptide repeat-containing protein [Kribbella sp. NBC_01245]